MKIFSALFDRSVHLRPRLRPVQVLAARTTSSLGMGGRELGRAPAGWPARVRQPGPIPAPQPGASGAFPGMGRGATGRPSSAGAMAGPGCGSWRPDPLRHHWAGTEGLGGLTRCRGPWAGQREPQKTGQGQAGPAEPQGPDRLCDAYSPKSQMKFHFVKGLLMGARHKSLWGRKWTSKATIQKYELPKGSRVFFRAHHRDRTTPSSTVDSRRRAAYCAKRRIDKAILANTEPRANFYETLRTRRRF